MKIKELLVEERPREKIKKYGPSVLGNSELIALILGYGSKQKSVLEISNKLLKNYSLNSLSTLSISELTKNFGIGEAKACKIVACFELARRLASFVPQERLTVNNAEDVARILIPQMSYLKKENFKAVYLDSRRRIIKDETIFVGSMNSSIVHPREIFEPAITEGAAAIILIHNHPSGDPAPSKADIEITKQLIECGEILEIEVLDHLIIGGNSYFSFREEGFLNT